MTPWLLLTAFTAAINLAVFVMVRGRWGRLVGPLALAALIGTVAGNAIGDLTGLEVLRLGDFNLVAASVTAQLAMLVTALLSTLAPNREVEG
jgi:uncharacterized membrane protein